MGWVVIWRMGGVREKKFLKERFLWRKKGKMATGGAKRGGRGGGREGGGKEGGGGSVGGDRSRNKYTESLQGVVRGVVTSNLVVTTQGGVVTTPLLTGGVVTTPPF